MKLHRMARHAVMGGGAALTLLLSACSVTPLQINQSNVASGALDAVVRFQPGGAGGLQLQVEGYRAKSTQHLDEGTSLTTDNGTMLSGPMDIHNSATVQRAFLGYNHRLFADRPVRLQWFAGVGWTKTRWSSAPESTTQPPQRWSVTGTGPAGGVLLTWQVSPLLSLEAAASGGVDTLASDADSVDWAQSELGLALHVADMARLRLGWAKRSMRASTAGSLGPDLTADTRGPYVKLAFDFR